MSPLDVKGVLFDLDETLLDHRGAASAGIAAWAAWPCLPRPTSTPPTRSTPPATGAPGPAFPDVAQAVAGLAGFALGVLTNGVQRVQEAKVRAIGLAGSYRRGARPRGVPAHHLADGAGAAAEGLNRLRRQLDTFVRTF
ncbi:hypothetical protein [Nonomuraea salmonea]|uniref:HAD family hydrolase n=1 Tax=Nonomuraea salmonea TaxID=46181 RepID=A0ABV5NUD1_9ACTN